MREAAWTSRGIMCAATALWVAACAPAPPPPPTIPTVSISRTHCGDGWVAPHPGVQVFRLHNTGSLAATARLVDPGSGVVYAEIDQLGPNATQDMSVTLGGGTYAFSCLPQEHEAVTGPAVHISGPATKAPAALPVSDNDLLEPVRVYHDRVQAGLDQLITDTTALRDAVRAGSPSARDRWLTAHLDYERLGAAYGTFGEFDDRINGPDSGFHRLEEGLWHGESGLAPVADQLLGDAHALRDNFAQQRIDPLDLGLRAHEILENTLQFELTGKTDHGSATNLATARANLDGTYAVLDVLRPLLRNRYPGLPEMDAALERVRRELDACRTPDGHWRSLTELAPLERERLNGAVGAALERLAPVAALTEPRRVP